MKRIDVIIVALILVCACAAMTFMSAGRRAASADEATADIYEDGVLTHSLPLDENREILLSTGRGYNRVVVEDGGIRVSDADCRSQTCVHSGSKALPGDMIACLPHRLVIKISGGEAPYDAITY
ncbi:MAG: NusG domain II-containing protein [Clostridiales Family XIII bacterium]|jgi:hypothetical protein|nr:NusG domain II-containing protein [Clostridiales Family XIII bacterium]